VDGDNGFSNYDPFSPGCDPYFDNCGGVAGEPVTIITPPPVVIIVNDNPAALGSVQNAVNALRGLTAGIISILGLLLQAITAIASLLKLLWDQVISPAVDELKQVLGKIQRILDRILKPMMDAIKAQRALIMDLYNKYIRPIIKVIEGLRRFIALLKIFHIHWLDKLDAQLAALEWRIMKPIFLLLYRLNTQGNWISFILNSRLLIFRGLFLQTLQHNQGGAFNVLAGAPAYGFPLLPQYDATAGGKPPQEDTYITAKAAVAAAAPAMALRFAGTPVEDLVKCLEAPIGNVDVSGAIDEMVCCLVPSMCNVHKVSNG
jgi:hypothetical protein